MQSIPGSFRDPAGFVFLHDGRLFRQINQAYRAHYDLLMSSGLYASLVDDGLLIPHEECPDATPFSTDAYVIIRPEPIPFISYPVEWCFSQLQDAARLTLRVQQRALEFGMSLKDCSAFNVQFLRGKPIFIDTLSFEPYVDGAPWVAYRQFCEHFLAPLALMAHGDVRLGTLLESHIHGIPLEMAARLLPWRTRFNLPLLMHVHLHARYQQQAAGGGAITDSPRANIPKVALQGMIDGLESAIRGLRWSARDLGWDIYYEEMPSYTPDAFAEKQRLVNALLDEAQPTDVWDIGANTGAFSRLASDRGIPTLSMDYDYAAVERNYRHVVTNAETHLLPLVIDVTHPTPSVGWMTDERTSLFQRGPADTALALALMHHLVIGNNLPLDKVAAFFAAVGRKLIIEYVPTDDKQVSQLLLMRDDTYAHYTQQDFESVFTKYYRIVTTQPIPGSGRILYLMQQ